jgi:hypothetical protein
VSVTPSSQQEFEDDRALLIEDIDLADDSELLRVRGLIEGLALPKDSGVRRGLQVSVLSDDQWETVFSSPGVPSYLRGGQQDHIHIWPHDKDPQHLLVSPSGVQGINERDRRIYQEVISAMVRAIPTALKGVLRRGVNEIVIEACGRRIGTGPFARTYPEDAEFVRALVCVLVREFGWAELDWALELRRNPDRALLALRQTTFCRWWLAAAKTNQELAKHLIKAGNHRRVALTDLLQDAGFALENPFGKLTSQALVAYLNESSTEKAS